MDSHQKYLLENQFNQVDILLKRLSSDFILKNHRAGKWSIHENIAHLARYHEIFQNRITKILEIENPHFGRYRTEDDQDFEKWNQLNTPLVIEKTKLLRKNICSTIDNLSPLQLQRKGSHPKFGTLTISEWIEFFLLHETHHFYTIFRIKMEYRG